MELSELEVEIVDTWTKESLKDTSMICTSSACDPEPVRPMIGLESAPQDVGIDVPYAHFFSYTTTITTTRLSLFMGILTLILSFYAYWMLFLHIEDNILF